MTMTGLLTLDLLLASTAIVVAAWFRPWQMLRADSLQHPWLAALVVLPWAWSASGMGGSGLILQVSGACLLVLMVGWPLAVWSLVLVAAGGAWLGGHGIEHGLAALLWYGIAPATVALGIGMAMRRWLPQHLFVYIMGRGFFATAIAVMGCGSVHALMVDTPTGLQLSDLLVGHWLLGWGEAMATGMLVATMVAFRPQWLATYSDRRYLPAR
jgi:uncharacterized membrane protein